MDPKVLADALVEAGILRQLSAQRWPDLYHVEHYSDEPLKAEQAITDWRVAGACLRAWPTTINTENLDMTLDEMLRDPAAICEAWFAAQGQGDG